MILPRICIQRPVLASMMSLALVLFGLISMTRLPVRELPDIDPPIVNVSTVYPGANASVVETEVTERIEEAVNNIEGIRTLTSQSREQVSNVTIEFDLSRDVDLAAQDVRDRVARVRGRLPEAVREPIIAKQDADAFAVIWIAMNSDRYSPLELSTLAEHQIKNRLQTVGGVSSIMIGGEKRFAMRLWLDAQRMAAHQVTVLDVQRALREQNVELPSGRVENLDREMTIQTMGELKTVDEYNRLVIRNDGIRIVRLLDIGEARDGVEEERSAARYNGRTCVFLGVVKQSKANTIEVAKGIKAELDRITPTLPLGVQLDVAYDESVFIQKAIHEVWLTLAIAFTLVIVVIYLFLRSGRATFIPAVAIPVSVIATFSLLLYLGYSINILTMLALVLVIGIVVDDTIVVLENIHRHIENGMRPMQAAFKAMDEISFAIITITISLVAVFLPLAFQTSTAGRLFTEFAVAIAGSVVISAFVALSLSAMLASRILKPVDPHHRHNFVIRVFERFLTRATRLYQAVLRLSLRHRWIVVGVGLVAVLLMTLFYRDLDKDFLPEEDKGRLIAFVIAPEGATAEYTDRMLRNAEGILAEIPEIQSFGSILAPGFSGPGQASFGILFVRLSEDRSRSVQEIVGGPNGLRTRLFREVEGAIANVQIPKAIGRGFSAPFQLVIQGQDLHVMDRHLQRIQEQLRETGFLINVRSSFEFNKPELRLDINRDRAAALGVSIEDVSRTMQILFGGLDLSRIKLDGKEHDVIAQLERFSRLTPQDLDRLYVRNNQGDLIQLSSLVSRHTAAAPNVIEHYNRLRSATISATPIGITLGNAMAQVEDLIRDELPPGFFFDWAGESRDLRTTTGELWFVLVLALVFVYMVLAAQFESLVHPMTVMLAVPLAAVGALGLLWFLDLGGKHGFFPLIPSMNINLFSQIGLVLLIGLVTKNSILLVEFANQQRVHGATAHDAMLQAGLIRLRPILMTALSTIAGILPIAIGFGAGAESRRPMGIAVIGGMLTSTFLTLIVVPVAYTLFSDLVDHIRKRKPALASPAPTASHPHPAA